MADYERAAVGLLLDRMAVEAVGAPELLAQAIHDQLGQRRGPVPVRAIAAALDIGEIRAEPLPNMEGTLVALQERGDGSVLVNSRSSPRRQRFTIAHELGHFLNIWHVSTEGTFTCRAEDMRLGGPTSRPSLTRPTALNAHSLLMRWPLDHVFYSDEIGPSSAGGGAGDWRRTISRC